MVLLVGLLAGACSRPAPSLNPAPVSTSKADTPVAATSSPKLQEYQPGQKHQEALRIIGEEDYVAAEAALQQVTAAEPGAAEAWNDLSLIQYKLGQYRDAAASAERALTLKPGFTYAEYNLGLALLQTGDRWRDARLHLEASAKAQPDRPEPWYALGTWYQYAGDLAQAKTALQKAGPNYGPARGALSTLNAQVRNWAEVQQVLDQVPQAPVQLIWNLKFGYVPQGYTRTVDQVAPIRLREKGETNWAALVRDRSSRDTKTSVQFQALNPTNDYLGSCAVPGSGPVTLQVLDQPGGQHLAVTAGGKTTICALKGRLVEAVFTATGPVSITPDGLMVSGARHQFYPELMAYVPASDAWLISMILDDIRRRGYQVEADSAAWSIVKLGPRKAFVMAWRDGVAFTTGGSADYYYFFKESGDHRLTYPFPYRTGAITVGGHDFVVVQTHMPDAPNGADILVLKTIPSSIIMRPVFSATHDGVGFDETNIFTVTKRYLPQGGFQMYRTVYTWDEAKYTFVAGQTSEYNP